MAFSGVAFVPNRVVADGREPAAAASVINATQSRSRRSSSMLRSSGVGDDVRRPSSTRGRVLRWWDGSHGNVLQVSALHIGAVKRDWSLQFHFLGFRKCTLILHIFPLILFLFGSFVYVYAFACSFECRLLP
jgi:hypothetical protein